MIQLPKCKSILIASGSFKDVYSPQEACEVIKGALRAFGYEGSIVTVPMVDGGEYSSDVLFTQLGAEKVKVQGVIGPMGKEMGGYYVNLKNTTAYIATSTILRLPPKMSGLKNPLNLTTYGYGQLIDDAYRKGYKNIILGMGGTNTVDCGIGMAQGLGVKFLDRDNRILSPRKGKYFTGIDLADIHNISTVDFEEKYKNVKIKVVCDADITVKQMYTPTNQKIGADFDNEREEILKFYGRNIAKYCKVVEDYLKSKKTMRNLPCNILADSSYFGTAGGILLTLFALFDLQISLGSEYFSKMFGLEKLIQDCDVVITGEGKLDNSLEGKTPVGVSRLAKKYGKPTVYLVGNVDKRLKKIFDSYVAETLPSDFKNNGITVIFSCHPFYDSMQLPGLYADEVDLYKKNNPRIFKDMLGRYFK